MLLLSEQTTLNHAGLNPQSIATVGSLLGDRPTIVAKPGGDGGQGAGSTTGGPTTLQQGLIYANTTVPGGNTVANTASQSFFTSKGAFPGNSLAVGGVIFIKAWGVYSTILTPTLTFTVALSTNQLLTTGALTCATAASNLGWWLEGQFHVTALGSTGTVEAQGYTALATAATTALNVDMTNTAPVTVNTTINRNMQISVTWSAASASNTITLRNFSVRYEQAQTFS